VPVRNFNEAGEIRENKLLAALPPDAFERLLPHLEPTALPQMKTLYDFDDTITHLYFPNRNAVISTLCRADEDVKVEVGLCGNEGAVGLSGLLGFAQSPYQNLVQVPGTGTRLALEEAKSEFSRCGAFHDVLLNYTHSFLLQVSQTALCNRIHSDDERLARWLLLSHDRIQHRQLPLPRELLGKMLGRNFAGVSVAASTLQRAGMITYNGAELVILDREKLESVACSCYWLIKRQASKSSIRDKFSDRRQAEA
jgi:Crp-like helix-turn-helix domain